MLSLASKLLNLAVSSQDCTRNNLRRSKIQNFPGGGGGGGGGPDPPRLCDTLRALATLLAVRTMPLRPHNFIAQICKALFA